MKPILFDTDVGTDVDDGLALALMAKSPEVEVLAVSTVSGNVALRARIARKILILAGKGDIPVAAGCATTLLRTSPGLTLGHEGKGVLEGEEDGTPYHSGHAVDLMVEKIKEASAKPTIVAIGPLTNIALAIIKEPWIIDRVEQLVIMGGCIYPERVGAPEFTLPEAEAARLEYNLGADPEAAQVVFGAGIPIVLMPGDVTYGVWLTDEDRAHLCAINTPLTDILSTTVDIWVDTFEKLIIDHMPKVPPAFARAYLHDPLAATLAFDRRFVETEPMYVRLECKSEVLRTLVEPEKEPNMEVVVSVDVPAFRDFFLERIGA